MQNIVEVRNIKFGEGMPKICVSLIEKNTEALLKEADRLKNLEVDIVEWRIDYHEEVKKIENILEALKKLRTVLGELPLLVTFRSRQEGGEEQVTTDYYVELNKKIAATGNADMIDIELFTGDEYVKELVEFAHARHVKVILSNHDFNRTPSKEEIINRLCKMQKMNADLPKIAVMPRNEEDVLTLLCATREMTAKYADRPIITIAMSRIGIVSRLTGEVFGSALTFGAAEEASAPGQIPVKKLAEVLKIIHEGQ